jgi:hypothetical protein
MEKDPLYTKIIEKLNGHLDSQIFQSCAGDLLRNIYPGLVPYTGGDDAGMDGAIPDFINEPYPLIVTTSEDAIGNLTRNLNQYISERKKQRQAVFATSRKLTTTRKENLFRRAAELGFTLHQIHDQEWFAKALYRDSSWRKTLLDLTGNPSALSKIPLNPRSIIDLPLIGREKDLEWLTTTKFDRLLIGQPGSGKTFLLNKFVENDGGLFLVSENHQEIANDIRNMRPKNIIVDDAHLKIDLLTFLIHIRREINADFGIIASSWTGDEDQVAQALQIDIYSINQLDPLTREQLVTVINNAGLIGPDQLIKEIIDQSNGQPGLAFTLVQVCFSSGTKDIFLGDAINQSIKKYFSPIIGKKSISILAAFSIGGNAGLHKNLVSNALGISPVELRIIVSQLAAGGVIWSVNQDYLAVYPTALRYALVKDEFFSDLGFPKGIFTALFENSPSLPESISVLIGTKGSGAHVDEQFLRKKLVDLDSINLWEQYSALGKVETNWVFENFPEKASALAFLGLYYIPEKAIPLLLSSAINDNRPLNSSTDHPLRVIQDWIQSSQPGTEAAIGCRTKLLDGIINWFDCGGNQEVGFKALKEVFSPRYESTSSNPGNGMKITFRSGCLTISEINQLYPQWERALKLFKNIGNDNWGPFFEILSDWLYPAQLHGNPGKEICNEMRQFGERMLKDLVGLVKNHPVFLRQAKKVSKDAKINIKIKINPEVDALYPIENRKDFKSDMIIQKQKADELASAWSRCDPIHIAFKLSAYEREANKAHLVYPRWADYVCRLIAEKTTIPLKWCQAGINADLTGDLVIPFLRKSIEQDDPEWINYAYRCLRLPLCSGSTISIILTLNSPPPDLLQQAIQVLNESTYKTNIVENTCFREIVPVETMRLLLNHNDPQIVNAAAYGEWGSNPQGIVRLELYKDWRDAVVEKGLSGYWLSEVFAKDSEIAYAWLLTNINKISWIDYSEDVQTVSTAIRGLNTANKLELLRIMKPDIHLANLVRIIVGDDIDLYRALLNNKALSTLHLEPLFGNPDNEIWITKAKEALTNGNPPEEIALASIYGTYSHAISWTGHESNMWQEWNNRFSSLQKDCDTRIQKIGDEGIKFSKARRQKALEEEKFEEIYGLDDQRRRRNFL